MLKSALRWSTALIELGQSCWSSWLRRGAVAEPFYVPSASMEPTLLIGDALVASKYPYGYGMAFEVDAAEHDAVAIFLAHRQVRQPRR